MAKITDRYATAVHSSNLKVTKEAHKADARSSDDVEILGAMGLADRDLTRGYMTDGTPVKPAPLAVSLERLFVGDNTAAHAIVRTLAQMAFGYSRRIRVKLQRPTAHDMACACLAWHRNGTCRACGGHGQTLIPGSKTHSGHECQVCRGTGKVLFDTQFRHEHRPIARWLVDEMEKEMSRAAPQAMRLLADSMNLIAPVAEQENPVHNSRTDTSAGGASTG